MGRLGALKVENDVLNKVDNSKITVEMTDVVITSRFGTASRRRTVPLFTQPSIVIVLGKEFTDIDIEFSQISMQLAKKQYEFVMELLSGNLAEEAQVATRVYPQRQIEIEDVITEEQKEKAKEMALEAGKEQLKKTMTIKLKIHQFSAHLLKGYGFEFDPLKHEGKDSLVSFKIDTLALEIGISQKIAIALTMRDMSLRDVSYDTVQNGVQEVYRDLVAFNNNFHIEDESTNKDSGSRSSTPRGDRSVFLQVPFQVSVELDQESNETNIGLKMNGLQFTFGAGIQLCLWVVT